MDTGDVFWGGKKKESEKNTNKKVRHRPSTGGKGTKLRAVWLSMFVVVSILSFTTTGIVGTAVANQQPVEIGDWNDLDSVSDDFGGDYVLVNDLDESTAGYDSVAGPTANGGEGFQPIGNLSQVKFTGTFDGNNYTISGLNISRPDTQIVGLFGAVDSPSEGGTAYVNNLRLEGVEVEGDDYVGGLIGYSTVDTSNNRVTGNVTGDRFVGGVVGSQQAGGIVHNTSAAVRVQSDNGRAVGGLVGTIDGKVSDSNATGDVVTSVRQVGGLIGLADPAVVTNSYATGDVEGAYQVGGLVGYGGDDITDSYATGNASGTDPSTGRYVGGLVGHLRDRTVKNSYASGHVYGEGNGVGGLVGYSYDGSIVDSNATGTVEGRTNGGAGGLLGDNNGGSVTGSYATGAVNNTGSAGGLVGVNDESNYNIASITTSYATGSVEAGDVAGGLVGRSIVGDITSSYAVGPVSRATTLGGAVGENATDSSDGSSGAIVDTYWDVSATGQTTGTGTGDDSGLVGLDTRDMKGSAAETNMTAFDFGGTWNTVDNGTHISYPFLRANIQEPAPGLEELGGGDPTPTPTPTSTPTPTPTSTPTPTPTPTPTSTPTPTATPSPTPAPVSGGGGGGGGGGAPGAFVQNSESISQSVAGAAQQVDIDFGQAISGSVSVTSLETRPAGITAPPGNAIATLDIQVPWSVRERPATIRLTIDRQVLNERGAMPEALSVYRFVESSNRNEAIPSTVESVEEDTVTLRIDTPGFSVFTVVSTETATATSPTQTTVSPTSTATASQTEERASGQTTQQEETLTENPTPISSPSEESTPAGSPGLGVLLTLIVLLVSVTVSKWRM